MPLVIRRFALWILIILSLSTTSIALNAEAISNTSLAPQRLMLSLVNHDRTQAGLSPLVWDEKLAQAATEHARLMANQGTLSHQLPGEPDFGTRLAAHDIRMGRGGENVVYDEDLASAHENFMNSPDHRENILDPEFNAIGIGVVDVDGVHYITEDFAHRVLDAADEQVAQVVAEAFKKAWIDAGNPDVPLSPDPRLRYLTRSMAQSGNPDASLPMALPGVAYAATFAVSDPEDLPIGVSRLRLDHKPNHYSVGVYYARTAQFPCGLYWVTIAVSYLPQMRNEPADRGLIGSFEQPFQGATRHGTHL
ncbi:MAG: CAP domain-containing protein [Terriglobales bacterium]|jgi:hypothetical protein